MGRKKKYNTEEERKAAKKESQRHYYQKNKEYFAKKNAEYYQNNRDECIANMSEYYQKNRDRFIEKRAEYRNTAEGRAKNIIGIYRKSDIQHNRGECSITPEWILENIFTKPCHYCGETDWHKLGCDRIDNDLPHTPENVVPCCGDCNRKKGTIPYKEFIKMHLAEK